MYEYHSGPTPLASEKMPTLKKAAAPTRFHFP